MILHPCCICCHEANYAMKLPKASKNRYLLATMTNEPFQPVRLYYSIPDRSFVTEKLRALKCMVEVPPEGCWEWLFHAEAASHEVEQFVPLPLSTRARGSFLFRNQFYD